MFGYEFDPECRSYEELREEFQWEIPERFNIGSAVLRHPGDVRRSTALQHVGVDGETVSFSYLDLFDATTTLACALESRDVGPGDVVAVSLPQSPEALSLYLAILSRGATVLPISILAGSTQVHQFLRRSDAGVFFVAPRLVQYSAPEPVEGCEQVEIKPWSADYTEKPRALGAVREYVRTSRRTMPIDTRPDDTAMLLPTSGSTGDPKLVEQRQQYLVGSMPGFQLWFDLFSYPATGHRVWTPTEWAWAGALFDVVFPTLTMGGAVVSSPRKSGFESERALSVIERQAVTRAFFPPTALSKIRIDGSTEDYSPEDLDIVMCGGEPLTRELRSWASDALDVEVRNAYGQTEANAVLGESRFHTASEQEWSGMPYPGHDVAVATGDDDIRRLDARGELLIELPDPVVFARYQGDPDGTQASFVDDRWLRTGDSATIDEDGFVTIHGRLDDVILTSGYRVDPWAVESVLEAHPDVHRAVVGAVPDEVRGKRIEAVIVADSQRKQAAFERDLQSAVAEELGVYAKPRRIRVREDLPVNAVGKLARDRLFPPGS